MKRWHVLVLVAALAAALPGCGDAIHRMLSNPASRTQALEVIAADSTLSAATADRLLASDPSRRVLIERLLASGEARQALLARAGRDRTFVDGLLNFAVQDSGMRDHVMTLARGMQMMGGR